MSKIIQSNIIGRDNNIQSINKFTESTNKSNIKKNKRLGLYYSNSRENVIKGQKKYQKYINFKTMLKIMKKRIDEEKRRLDIYNLLEFSKTTANNIIENENLHMTSKPITNNNLNNKLNSDREKALIYIELLDNDFFEYLNRYRQHQYRKILNSNLSESEIKIKIDEIDNNIKIVGNEIQNIIQDTLNKKIKYSKLKHIIKEKLYQLNMPDILFNLFRTRKGIRDLSNQHIEINYKKMKTNNNNLIKNKLNRHITNKETYNNTNGNLLEIKKNIIKRFSIKNSINSIIYVLGIYKIVKFNKRINNISKVDPIVYSNIAQMILDYMVPIETPIEYLENPIFTRKCDYLRLCLSYEILKNFNSEDLFLTVANKNRKILAFGFLGKVFIKNQNILKYEHLDFRQPNINFTEGHTYYPSNTVVYLFNNYVVFVNLIQSLIQNYLYNLDKHNPKVPCFKSYSVSYEKDQSLTIMENAFSINNNNNNIFVGTLMKFITDEANNEYSEIYIKNLLIILKELCSVLKFYQEKCYFVHGDCHPKNITLYCEFNENHLIQKIYLKLIDFGRSSIIINIDGELKILKNINFGTFRMFEQVNPYISNIWNKIDILYLISNFIYNLNNDSSLKNFKENKNIKEFLKVFLNILNLQNNIYEKILDLNKKIKNSSSSHKFKLFISFFKSDKLINLRNSNLINEELFYSYFIPKNLENLLHNYIIYS